MSSRDETRLPFGAELPVAVDEDEQPEVEVSQEDEEEQREHVPGELRLPDGYRVVEGEPIGGRRGVAIVVARFNGEITSLLLESALAELEEVGVPQEFLDTYVAQGVTEFKFEVGAIEASGNQTFSEGTFCTVDCPEED